MDALAVAERDSNLNAIKTSLQKHANIIDTLNNTKFTIVCVMLGYIFANIIKMQICLSHNR